mmetsp:Transcript_1084/g.2227  ORF Transcript_1084/g.2227 Transcript_1084/m.2227 type:complete len:396 (-) Transcript_1084:325-1512(-)
MFKNRPDQVSDVCVDPDQSQSKLYSAMKDAVRAILTGNGDHSWNDCDDADLTVSPLTGGITNILYLISKSSENKFILRLYGRGTSDFIDRGVENIVFSKLSELNIGPTFHGRFANGRVEGFLPAIALESDQMKDCHIYPKIATSIAKLHSLEIPEIKSADWLWNKIRGFLKLARGSDESPLVGKMQDQLDWLQEFVLLHSNTSTGTNNDADAKGREFALQEVLCHNDLLCGNVLYQEPIPQQNPQGGKVFLIDYEYAAYNYRAFDLANHFSEHCGFEYDYEKTLPAESFMLAFLKEYLRAHSITTADTHTAAAADRDNSSSSSSKGGTCRDSDRDALFLQGMLEAVRWMLLASHLFWGAWSLVQARCSSIDFDYLAYAQRRFDAYTAHKPQYAKE